MSWDIFVMDLPRGIGSVADIPDDFKPSTIGPRKVIVEAIAAVAPGVDFSDPTWGYIDDLAYSIEVNIGEADPVESFAFHVRGGDLAVGVIADILERLDLQAIDPQSESGLFDPASATESLQRWRAYRDSVIQ